MNTVTSFANVNPLCLDSPLTPTSSDILLLSNCAININQIANHTPRNRIREFPFIAQSLRIHNYGSWHIFKDFPPSTPPPQT